MKSNKRLVEARKIEVAATVLMLLFGVAAIAVFIFGVQKPEFGFHAMIMEMFLVLLIAVLAQTLILVKMLERLY